MAKQASIVGNTARALDPRRPLEEAPNRSAPHSPQCPKCGGSKMDVAYGPYGIRERAAVVVLRFPVECGACGHRFALSVFKGDLDLVLRRRHVVVLLIVLLLLLWGVFLAGFTLASARHI